MSEIGEFISIRVDGKPRITRADPYVLISAELVNDLRDNPTGWAWADNDSVTFRDERATYTYRLVPHGVAVYAGELTRSAHRTASDRPDVQPDRRTQQRKGMK